MVHIVEINGLRFRVHPKTPSRPIQPEGTATAIATLAPENSPAPVVAVPEGPLTEAQIVEREMAIRIQLEARDQRAGAFLVARDIPEQLPSRRCVQCGGPFAPFPGEPSRVCGGCARGKR